MTHEMIHSKGINLFDCIRCFDKNSTDENDLVPKLTYSNLKISIEGKQTKLYSLLELQTNILNRKLSQITNYNFDNNGHYCGMFFSLTMASTTHTPYKVLLNYDQVVSKAIYVPNEFRISSDDIGKFETMQELAIYKINMKLKSNQKKIDEYTRALQF